jgi:hypothetical protein
MLCDAASAKASRSSILIYVWYPTPFRAASRRAVSRSFVAIRSVTGWDGLSLRSKLLSVKGRFCFIRCRISNSISER